jgi:Na+/H+ antiporter NhaD/arsenite permease-like protein
MAAGLLVPAPALAAEGVPLAIWWGIPFVGLLLSIAMMPLVAGHFWHANYGKVAALWGALFIIPYALVFGAGAAWYEVTHVLLLEYIPFIALLLALYTVGGGILLRGRLVGTPATNTALLGVGTALASLMGTTGASMVLIRPVIRANSFRSRKIHVFVFFIFLVSNIGGSLTPLGDPPLYLGFLRGVSFFWPTTQLFWQFAVCAAVLLSVFYVFDLLMWRAEKPRVPDQPPEKLAVEGRINILLLAAVVGFVLLQGIWRPGEVPVLGQQVALPSLVAIVAFGAITLLSMAVTPRALREANGFAWGAMAEVAKLFAAIFLTMAPVLAMLREGVNGPLGALVALTSNPDGTPNAAMYFWLTGGLSSFLDNAPTYLVFFNLAGGDPQQLMTTGALTLAAISCGAVFMGANSYIGNAPNFMVKAIVEENGIRMPSFFGYVGWACVFLLPLFALVTGIFFL